MAALLDAVPRWTGGYHQEGWAAPSIPIFELTMAFTIVLYLWESYLDMRQHARVKATGDAVPADLKTLVAKVDKDTLARKKSEPAPAPTPPADAAEKKEGDDEEEKKEQIEDGKMLETLETKAPKSQVYGLDKLGFGMTKGLYKQFENNAFLLLGAMPLLWDYSEQIAESMGFDPKENEVKVSLIWFAISTIIDEILGTPWAYWSTFVVEDRHGFNKTTIGTFIKDKLISLALTFAIGGPVMFALLHIIKWGGPYFYLYVWAFMFCFSIFFLTIFPVYIQPLFNKYTPLEEGPLQKAIYELAGICKFPLTKLYVVDGSKRSSHSNAYMYGFGKNKRIVMFDTLINQMSTKELVAVLGHEIGHWAYGHVLQNFLITQIYVLCAFMAFGSFVNSPDLYHAFGFVQMPTVIGLMLFFQTVWAPVDSVLNFVLTLHSRHKEFSADQYSLNLGYSADLQQGLVKMSIENLSILDPDPMYSVYHHTHPPLLQRLRALQPGSKKKD